MTLVRIIANHLRAFLKAEKVHGDDALDFLLKNMALKNVTRYAEYYP